MKYEIPYGMIKWFEEYERKKKFDEVDEDEMNRIEREKIERSLMK